MSALMLVPTTATIQGWLILVGLALLVLCLGSGIGEWLAHVRRTTTRAPIRPWVDDLIEPLSDEAEYRRAALRRLERIEMEDARRAAEVHE